MNQLRAALFVVVGALVGGAAGAVTTLMATSTKGDTAKLTRELPEAKPGADAEGDSELGDSELGDSVDTLRARLNSLERRVSLLTFAQEHSSPTREVTADGAEAREGGGGDDTAGARPKKTVDDPVFEAAVRDVLDQVAYERDAQRDAQRAERRTEWTNRWLGSLSEQLELNQEQEEKVQGIVRQHFDAMRELRNGDNQERPVLRSEWRARMNELAQKAEQDLAGVLDGEQKQKYDALDDTDKLGGRGSFGRFGGGDRRQPPAAGQ